MTNRTTTGSSRPPTCGRGFRLSPNPWLNPFGMTRRELLAEIRLRAGQGWQLWELRTRFAADRTEDGTP
ncbi:hypothetical protein SRB5_39270 [Streptomyces sp. RB5]|uniref:Uncharacterized protein n=1 Tax=Streptomyces smaragdinus TaxID=2585196 RepID=A0A7K0CLY0_9ACTN|nr:hypothetical protein [Streptomyces smaragdinus]MQY13774.1 hypothetical protein [Streptomyces smaragdinus]